MKRMVMSLARRFICGLDHKGWSKKWCKKHRESAKAFKIAATLSSRAGKGHIVEREII